MTLRLRISMALATAWLGVIQPGWPQATIGYFQSTRPILLHTYGFDEFFALDIDGDDKVDFTFAYNFQFLGVQPTGTNRILTWMDPWPNIGASVAPLPQGFDIGHASAAGSLGWYGSALDYNPLGMYFDVGSAGAFVGHRGYMGVEFQRGGARHYGWMLLQVSDYSAFCGIDSWAYETRPNTPIKAGARPVMVGFAVPVVARPGYLRLSWLSEIGKAYQVQAKASLDAFGWTNLNFAVPATTTNTLLDLPMTGAAQFFRVVEAD